ncbi:hypothetical protein EDB83DRAFT_81049 [Lactarius deliciosus]|nr:hypothetical protein EDB83DRAFT_81049 [Lactarius deliciosus]
MILLSSIQLPLIITGPIALASVSQPSPGLTGLTSRLDGWMDVERTWKEVYRVGSRFQTSNEPNVCRILLYHRRNYFNSGFKGYGQTHTTRHDDHSSLPPRDHRR